MCKQFKTCGQEASETDGEAHVNIEIVDYFNLVQQDLEDGKCMNAKKYTKKIEDLFIVPFLQGTLLALQKDQAVDSRESRADAVSFTLLTLPQVKHCDDSAAKKMVALLDPKEETSSSDTFKFVDKTFQENYDCMKVTGKEVGGISGQGSYGNGADVKDVADLEPVNEPADLDPVNEPADLEPANNAKKGDSGGLGITFLWWVFAIALLGVAGFFVNRYFRLRRFVEVGSSPANHVATTDSFTIT